MFDEALAFAMDRHADQKRWGGGPYIDHPQRVSDKFSDDIRKTVAILHDVVEDEKATLQEIKDLFGLQVSTAVDAISRRSGESYHDFILRVEKNQIARDVKIADIEDNMEDVSATDLKQIEKAKNLKTKRYVPALLFLKGKNVQGR